MSTRPIAQKNCVVCSEPGVGQRCLGCGCARRPGGFVVEALIAESEHGRVYRARAPDGGLVALKELVYATVPSAAELDRFEREAQVLAMLQHPRTPRVVGHFREGEGSNVRLYIAQTFIEGRSLAQRLEREPLREPQLLEVARSVLLILNALHTSQPRILHRDVKPANIIERPDGRLFLVDFGASRLLGGDVTYGGTLTGTFGYMPVEQLGGTVDASTDLHALGATLLHLATGRQPAALLGPDMHLLIPPGLQVSPQTRGVLERLVAPRDRRFTSARQALQALDGPRPSRKKENQASRRGKAALAVGFVAVLGALVTYLVSREPLDTLPLLLPTHDMPLAEVHRSPSGNPIIVIADDGPLYLSPDLDSEVRNLAPYLTQDLRAVSFAGPDRFQLPDISVAGPVENCLIYERPLIASFNVNRVLGRRVDHNLWAVNKTLTIILTASAMRASTDCVETTATLGDVSGWFSPQRTRVNLIFEDVPPSAGDLFEFTLHNEAGDSTYRLDVAAKTFGPVR